MFKIMFAVLFFTIITLVVFVNIDPNISQSMVLSLSDSSNFMSAQLSGEIVSPGTYLVEKGATLSQLTTLAGGTREQADSLAFDLDLAIEHGRHYYIAPLYDPSDVCGSTLLVKVGLNSADKNSLMTLSNIGSSLADAIILYRTQQGQFRYLEQIMFVSGIGNSTFSRIKNYITLA